MSSRRPHTSALASSLRSDSPRRRLAEPRPSAAGDGPRVAIERAADLDQAVRQLRGSGGTIVLRAGRYPRLVVTGSRERWLTIVAARGASVGPSPPEEHLEGQARAAHGFAARSPCAPRDQGLARDRPERRAAAGRHDPPRERPHSLVVERPRPREHVHPLRRGAHAGSRLLPAASRDERRRDPLEPLPRLLRLRLPARRRQPTPDDQDEHLSPGAARSLRQEHRGLPPPGSRPPDARRADRDRSERLRAQPVPGRGTGLRERRRSTA